MRLRRGVKARVAHRVRAGACIDANNGSLADEKVYSRREPSLRQRESGKGMRGLSLEEANTIIEATFAAAKKRKCRPMSAIVLDAGGRVKAFQKQDGASMLRFEICYGKAYGALALGRPSKLVLQKARKSRYSCSPWRVSPIIRCFLKAVVNSSATGRASCCAVGITGDANEPDDLCAIAGIHAAKLCADSDFFDDPDLMRAVSIHSAEMPLARKQLAPTA